MENLNNGAREIPYWKNILVNCPNCWFKWEPGKYRKWNIFLEIILWLLFLIPWVIYTSLRHINTFCLCPKCKQQFLLEMDWDNNLIDMLCKIRRKQLCWFWVIVIGFSILWVASLSWLYKNYQKNVIENNSTYNYQQNNTYDTILPEDKQDFNIDASGRIRSMVQWTVDWINKTYKEDYFQKNENFSWAYCVWDCANWIINIDWTAYPYAYNYDDIVAWMASSKAVNLSFWMWNKPVVINLNIDWRLFVSCSWANTVINCERWDYFDK